MKLSAIVILFALSGVFASDARAQEAGLPLSVEAVTSQTPQLQRTPTLVIINEAVKPTQNTATLAPKPQSATTKKAPGQSVTAAAPATSGPPAPLVMQSVTTVPQTADSMVATTGNPKYDELIKQSAARNGIDPNLMVAVMRQESGFNLRARSYKGASGLMQLMPGTARRFGVNNIYDPAENIEGGAKYLRFLLELSTVMSIWCLRVTTRERTLLSDRAIRCRDTARRKITSRAFRPATALRNTVRRARPKLSLLPRKRLRTLRLFPAVASRIITSSLVLGCCYLSY